MGWRHMVAIWPFFIAKNYWIEKGTINECKSLCELSDEFKRTKHSKEKKRKERKKEREKEKEERKKKKER